MIRVLFFDVGGTLIAPNPSVGDIYSQVAERHGITVPPDVLNENFQAIWKVRNAQSSQMNRDWWENIVHQVFANYNFSNFSGFFNDLYHTFENPQSWLIFSDVKPTLEKLRELKFRCAVASNWDDRLPQLLGNLGLTTYFEKFFISSSMHFSKSHPQFFSHALKQMNVNPLEAIHVGDNEREDMAAAEAAGMRAYLINRKKKPLNSRMMISLDEIFSRIS